jgi:hypothetical protein
VAHATVGEEVLHHPHQLTARDRFANLLRHFANHRRRGQFSAVDAPTGERPEGIAFQPVQQHLAAVQDDRCGAQIEAVGIGVERNHAR